ncbi:MAG: ribonuclease HI family protein [Candidatus Kariarchaeaceae archaeon]
MTEKIILFFDGASRGNPGESGAGWLIIKGKEKVEGADYLGKKTNNQAEYTALIRGLEEAVKRKWTKEISIKGDSELIMKQLKGEYQVKSERIKPLYKKVVKLLQKFDKWECKHVKREKNKKADRLANKGIDERKK